MEAVLVPARHEHAFVLASTMRPADVAELAACGQTPLEGLLKSMSLSEYSWAILYDDVVGAVGGVRRMEGAVLGHVDELWMLTGELFGQKPMAFFRVLKQMVATLLERYATLVNVIDARYTGAMRLAEALGATLSEPHPFGIHGEPFVLFTLRSA